MSGIFIRGHSEGMRAMDYPGALTIGGFIRFKARRGAGAQIASKLFNREIVHRYRRGARTYLLPSFVNSLLGHLLGPLDGAVGVSGDEEPRSFEVDWMTGEHLIGQLDHYSELVPLSASAWEKSEILTR
jgi:hypothetical protein